MSGLSSKGKPPRTARSAPERYRLQRYVQPPRKTSESHGQTDPMYDVIYIDAHGSETPVAQHLDDRRDAADVARQAAADRGVGRMSSRVPPSCRTASASCRSRGRPKPPFAQRTRQPLASRAMRIGVVGGGLMGSGIAEVCARAGVDVTVVEADDGARGALRAAIEKSLDRAVRGGKLEQDDREAAASGSPSAVGGGPRGRRRGDRGDRRGRARQARAVQAARRDPAPTRSSSPPTRRRCRS